MRRYSSLRAGVVQQAELLHLLLEETIMHLIEETVPRMTARG